MKRKKGFTLIELVLIIGLLATIIAVASPNIFAAKGQANKEACRDQMDFILNGFQSYQFDSDSIYAFDTLSDGETKLNQYIAAATDPVQYVNAGMEAQVQCPSGTTDYVAVEDGEKLYIHCNTDDVDSHGALTARPARTKQAEYSDNTMSSNDNNWIVGDHETLSTMPLPSQYYHMEIQFKMMKYDNASPGSTSMYEYDYDDPDWFWPLNEDYYDVTAVPKPGDPERPYYYDLDQFNPTNDDLFFGLIIDYQEKEGTTNFTSNALEIKNINSNAGLDMELDLVERDSFNSKKSDHATHQRDLMDDEADWFIIDVIEDADGEHTIDGTKMKRMVIHMQSVPKNANESNFSLIFDDWVPIADESEPVSFGFFMGNRDVDTVTKVGQYHYDSYPTPVQSYINRWNRDFDCGNKYETWISKAYKDYDGAEGSTIPEIPFVN